MNVNSLFIASTPFHDAFMHSDILGKIIIAALVFLSVITWALIVHKGMQAWQARRYSEVYYEKLREKNFSVNLTTIENCPYGQIYSQLHNQKDALLKKNAGGEEVHNQSYFLTNADMETLTNCAFSSISRENKQLEHQLYVLSTIVTLAPFIGLLGTVWGILTTFSQMQLGGASASSQMILGGLSLALATTVLGLIDAIPALIGYNWLKNVLRNFEKDMESFSFEVLTAIEMQYRK